MKIVVKAYYILSFLLFYLVKLIQANIIIAFDILTPKMRTSPGFIDVPVKLNTNLGLLLFNNLLSMTPGTLCVDISEDKKYLLIHCLYNENKESVLEEVESVQRRIKRITE